MPQPDPCTKPVAAVAIADREVGPSRPAFIVAELGVNHDGDVDTALRLIASAHRAGVDAVKFQMFSASDLTTASAPTAPYQASATGSLRQHDMLAALELTDDAFAALCDECGRRDLAFMATPFAVHDVKRLARLNPPAVKIASTDLNNTLLLEAASGLDLPLVVSTGAATSEEIAAACACLEALGARDRTILLHCISAYPAALVDLNLRAIGQLERLFGMPVGFSDHAADVRTGAWAVAHGAVALEVHVTLDRARSGPDHASSLEPDELAAYVRHVRELEAARGTGAVGMCAAEEEVRRVARKSIVAAEDIEPGTVIAPRMLTVKRPGTGLVPADMDLLVGRTASRGIARDTLLSWDMVR